MKTETRFGHRHAIYVHQCTDNAMLIQHVCPNYVSNTIYLFKNVGMMVPKVVKYMYVGRFYYYCMQLTPVYIQHLIYYGVTHAIILPCLSGVSPTVHTCI